MPLVRLPAVADVVAAPLPGTSVQETFVQSPEDLPRYCHPSIPVVSEGLPQDSSTLPSSGTASRPPFGSIRRYCHPVM